MPNNEKVLSNKNRKYRSKIFHRGLLVGHHWVKHTPDGNEIEFKKSMYFIPDKNACITHIIRNKMVGKEIVKYENLELQKDYKNRNKIVKISIRNDTVIGCSVKEKYLNPKSNVRLQSNTQISKDEVSPNLMNHVESCVFDDIDYSKYEKEQFPSKCRILENDLFKNQLLGDFKGNYIGNIFKITDNICLACIVTKDENNCKYYTLVDLTGTSITNEASTNKNGTPNYLDILIKADKSPNFKTKIGEDGKETLISEYLPYYCYYDFLEDFISPLPTIEQINKFREFFKN
ncbi:MAG: hypothetical protein HUJ68_06960, partial [Clostridia bacterium]|nr:hypothetical protein [Clostridia bacterium]